MTIILEKASIEDWYDVNELEKAAASRIFHAVTGEEPAKQFIRTYEVFFIIKDAKRVGVVAYKESKDGIYIGELIVSKEFSGQGIGQAAMTLILDKLGNTKVWLVTHPENSRAIGLYLKLGFQIKAWKDNYYNDGEPRLILERVVK